MPVMRFLAKVNDLILSDPFKDYKQYKKALWDGLDERFIEAEKWNLELILTTTIYGLAGRSSNRTYRHYRCTGFFAWIRSRRQMKVFYRAF
jgi:hypothetical protein